MSEIALKPGFYRFIRGFFHVLSRILFRLEVHGTGNIPESGGCLLASNHASYLDPPLIGCAIKHRTVQFMARRSLFRFKPFGWFLRQVGTVPIDPGRGDLSALRTGIRLLKEGKMLCLYPEGTRTYDGRLQKAKGGIGLMIARAKVPVVPAYIDGSYEALPRRAKILKPKKVHVYYGPPIPPDELPVRQDGKPDYKGISELVMSRIAAQKPRAEGDR